MKETRLNIMKEKMYVSLCLGLLTLPLCVQAASPTGDAFSKQIMLGVKVSTNNMTDISDTELGCVNALSNTMLGDAFDGIFNNFLSKSERTEADDHYNSVLAKRYFDLFAERTRSNSVNDPEMTQQYLMQHNEAEIRYMHAFTTSPLGKKVMSVLTNPTQMTAVKTKVVSELQRCRQQVGK